MASVALFVNAHLFLAFLFMMVTFVGSLSLIPVTTTPHPLRVVFARSCAILCLLAALAIGISKHF